MCAVARPGCHGVTARLHLLTSRSVAFQSPLSRGPCSASLHPGGGEAAFFPWPLENKMMHTPHLPPLPASLLACQGLNLGFELQVWGTLRTHNSSQTAETWSRSQPVPAASPALPSRLPSNRRRLAQTRQSPAASRTPHPREPARPGSTLLPAPRPAPHGLPAPSRPAAPGPSAGSSPGPARSFSRLPQEAQQLPGALRPPLVECGLDLAEPAHPAFIGRRPAPCRRPGPRARLGPSPPSGRETQPSAPRPRPSGPAPGPPALPPVLEAPGAQREVRGLAPEPGLERANEARACWALDLQALSLGVSLGEAPTRPRPGSETLSPVPGAAEGGAEPRQDEVARGVLNPLATALTASAF